MEESEKRKERLKAMRMEAAHAEVSNNVETSAMPGCLSNPLSGTSSRLTMEDDFCAIPRFDYYTDPMAAFSANKKRGKGDNQTMLESFPSPTSSGWPTARPSPSHPGPRNSDRNLPVLHMQSQFSLDQHIYQQGPYGGFTAHRSPRITSPPMHQSHSDAWNGSQATANSYNYSSDGRPRGMFGTPPMHPRTSPRVWNPSNAPGSRNLPSPGFSPAYSPNFNYGRGRPQMFGNSPILDSGPGDSPGFSSGRGRARGYGGSISPGMGRTGGRGQAFHGRSSASNRTLGAECFFDESMLEDPWQHLKPILWRRQEAGMDSLSTPGSSNSRLPKSIGVKKAKVSEASNKFNSQPSLAEYLAASFNKAVEDAQNA
ncbi:protein SICKLE-like [Durio zibethinus]|uniref:Protein SICKLE-like n=1 Tax=Durio zibethinus TaxID=66656 RepID=A0A6P5YQ18_DURZI|nr:protein SICKLE-like [Durio zibethinus]XP_022742601.1 protein SICKLE-like [Durio zibethinus]XP_022742602.1 protein SICKLE-like [Durio zibethinus]XP_022742603.1 protein SICKLE-like [Durio zibethinus]XP_022742604.1 protein SICKLE-like [Durio zibethinus]